MKNVQSLCMLWLCCFGLTDCGAVQHHDETFSPELVSCEARSFPEAVAAMRILKKDRPHRPTPHDITQLSARIKDWANQGDPVAMMFFGGIQYNLAVADIMNGKYGQPEGKFFPDSQHDALVIAWSYMYLSANIKGTHQREALDVIGKIDRNVSGLTTPPMWTTEAKANLEHWQEHCAYAKGPKQ